MSENQNYIITFVLSVICPENQSFIEYSEWISAKSRLSENTYLFVAATFRLRFFKIPQSKACGYDIIIKIIQFSDSLKHAGMTIINSYYYQNIE